MSNRLYSHLVTKMRRFEALESRLCAMLESPDVGARFTVDQYDHLIIHDCKPGWKRILFATQDEYEALFEQLELYSKVVPVVAHWLDGKILLAV